MLVAIAVAVSLGLAWSMGLLGAGRSADDLMTDQETRSAEAPVPLDLPDLANDVTPQSGQPTEPVDAPPPVVTPPTPPVAASDAKPVTSRKPKSILPTRPAAIRLPRPAETIRAAATRATPIQPLERLFSRSDYPASARSAREQGTTSVMLGIDPAGRAITCRIAASSGSVALDAATCRVLVGRARFTPAIDESGVRTSDSYVQRIRWKLK